MQDIPITDLFLHFTILCISIKNNDAFHDSNLGHGNNILISYYRLSYILDINIIAVGRARIMAYHVHFKTPYPSSPFGIAVSSYDPLYILVLYL